MREFLVDVLTSILIKKNKPVSYFFLLTNLLYEENKYVEKNQEFLERRAGNGNR